MKYPGSQLVTGALAVALVGIGIYLAAVEPSLPLFLLFVGLSLILGIQLVMPIGGADMPVVISLLNSYTGIAVAATGFVLSTTTRCSSPARSSERRARSSPSSCARR